MGVIMNGKSGYRIVLEDCMSVQEDETVLILTDDNKIKIGNLSMKKLKDWQRKQF